MLAFPELEPELRDRLLLGPADFDAFLSGYLGAVPARECGAEQLEHGLAYPWARPARSYVLRGEHVELFDDMAEAERRQTVVAFARDRHPILAFGSNAAPSALTRKFAHFADDRDQEILVLAGDLHEFDVGPAATVAAYGALPATLFASPGTAVRAAVLYTTAAQATQLTWSELSYFFGRLDDVRFEVDEADVEITAVLAYASRFGTFSPGGERVALAAVPARGRTAAPRTQRELLDTVARLALGPGKRAEDVVELVYTDLAGLLPKVRDHVRPAGQPFAAANWVPFSG